MSIPNLAAYSTPQSNTTACSCSCTHLSVAPDHIPPTSPVSTFTSSSTFLREKKLSKIFDPFRTWHGQRSSPLPLSPGQHVEDCPIRTSTQTQAYRRPDPPPPKSVRAFEAQASHLIRWDVVRKWISRRRVHDGSGTYGGIRDQRKRVWYQPKGGVSPPFL